MSVDKPQFALIQGGRDATHCNDGGFSPVTATRTQVTPPTRKRLMRRFFELSHSIRRIAATEEMQEKAVEQMVRETYWSAVNGDTGPLFPAGASRPSGIGGGLLRLVGRRAA
jgi:hypothetical protein